MAIVVAATQGARYLRIDGIRVGDSLKIGAQPERRADGNYDVPATRPVSVQVYAYASAIARSAGDPPLWHRMQTFTLGQLGFSATLPGTTVFAGGPAQQCIPFTTEQLWASLYACVSKMYDVISHDLASRADDFAGAR